MTFWNDIKHSFNKTWNDIKTQGIRKTWHDIKKYAKDHPIIKKLYYSGKDALLGALPEAAETIAELEMIGSKIDKYLESDEVNELSKKVFEAVDEIGAKIDKRNRFLE